jgi:hypothetical protein
MTPKIINPLQLIQILIQTMMIILEEMMVILEETLVVPLLLKAQPTGLLLIMVKLVSVLVQRIELIMLLKRCIILS